MTVLDLVAVSGGLSVGAATCALCGVLPLTVLFLAAGAVALVVGLCETDREVGL